MLRYTCDMCDADLESIFNNQFTILLVPGGREAVWNLGHGIIDEMPAIEHAADICHKCRPKLIKLIKAPNQESIEL
jgi:hypothetical protein